MEPFLAQVMMFAGNFAPRGWAFCDGQLLAISQNTAVFSLMGTTFGGDGRTTFGLPELRGRTAVHPGTGPGLSNIRWGDRGGNETTTLLLANLPNHSHTGTLNVGDAADSSDYSGNYLNKSTGRSKLAATNKTGTLAADAVTISGTPGAGNTAFSNRSPFTGIYHCIALQGIFPSRS